MAYLSLAIMGLAVCGILFIVIDKQQKMIERQNEMIMARTYAEYKEHTGEVQTYDPVDITEEEEYHREIEAMKV